MALTGAGFGAAGEDEVLLGGDEGWIAGKCRDGLDILRGGTVGKEAMRKTKKEVRGCSQGGHKGGRCDVARSR